MAIEKPKVFYKDPDATLDYTLDWSEWMVSGDEITDADFIVPAGLTKVVESNDTTKTTVWLSGGTVGQSYSIVCRITTSGGRIDDRTFTIVCLQR